MMLKDKVAIITGGSRGIGFATADKFLKEGATVILAASTQKSADNAVTELKEKYPLYIVSNCQSGYIEAFLDHYGFRKYFEDIECYGNNLKQKGDNIRLLADRNGLTEAVYVGDIQGDYDASCHAGVGFIHAAYGFGTIAADVPEIHTFEELTETADQYFALR